jgi:hypothetical protein
MRETIFQGAKFSRPVREKFRKVRVFTDNTKWYSPRHVIRDLFGLEYFDKKVPIWECACGDNRLTEEMIKLGYLAKGTDLTRGHDFRTMSGPRVNGQAWRPESYNIVTNPPFPDAATFLRHAFDLAHSKVAMLLPLEAPCASDRIALFHSPPGGWRLAAMYHYYPRLHYFRPDGSQTRGNANFESAWWVWEKGKKSGTIRFGRIVTEREDNGQDD